MKRLAGRHEGQVLVIVAIALVVLLAMVGLALDVGIAYGVKAKLYAAVDAAAIAAGRGIKQGASDDVRIQNARDEATRFFNANFPAGAMGATVPAPPTINAVHNTDGSWTISADESAFSPTYFARVLGWNNFTVKASAQTTVRDLDMVLVIDSSGSLADPDPSDPLHPAFDHVKAAAVNFLNNFSSGAGGDRIGLVMFASGATVSVPIDRTSTRGFDKTAMLNILQNTSFTASGSTSSGEAMRLAKQELDAVPSQYRSGLRVIVFFSDGAPNDVAVTIGNGANAFTGSLYSETPDSVNSLCSDNNGHSHIRPNRTWFVNMRNNSNNGGNGDTHGCNIQHLPNQDWSQTVNLESYDGKRNLDYEGNGNSKNLINNRCNVNKAARNMVENVANAARSGSGNTAATVYTLGLGDRLRTLEIDQSWCGYGNEEWGENILKRLANTSDSDTHNASQPTGMYVYAQNATDLDKAFQTIANQILRLTK